MFKWLERRRKTQQVLEVLPLMYDELHSRQRAIVFTLMRKRAITAREAIDLMAIFSSDDFEVWMSRQPKLETFQGPAEISEEVVSDEPQSENYSDDIGPYDCSDSMGSNSG